MTQRIPLPVDEILPSLKQALTQHPCVLVCAPPGSGKTTRVPPAVRDEVGGQKVILLQPRRVAARASAKRLAYEEGCAVGEEVGFRVRFDNQSGPNTKIEVLTEGLLLRQLQSDPFLTGVGAVILDEFHERSLNSDLALALLREIQQDVRSDLKLIVMSATLDVQPIQDFLGGPAQCPVLEAEGQRFEVETTYLPPKGKGYLDEHVAAAVQHAIRDDPEGHVLVFLPGVGEIERTRQRLQGKLKEGTTVLPLHGSLSSTDQDKVLRPSSQQKVVLATNLAETSLTLEGVTCVIDSGLVRRPKFDARLGVDRLETIPHSQASATQRAGRAGRTKAGRCLRLWSKAEQARRNPHDEPEVQLTDLASVVLQLHAWGTQPDAFAWFERPPEAALGIAESLLTKLGALVGEPRKLTESGAQLAKLPVHPRLGMVILRGKAIGTLNAAASAAALASERDPWRKVDGANGDLLSRLTWIDSRSRTGADPRALDQVRKVRDQLTRLGEKLPVDRESSPFPRDQKVLDALIAGFPDRVGMRRSPEERAVLLSGGGGAELGRGVVTGACFVAVVMTAGLRGKPPTVRVAADVNPDLIASKWANEAYFDRERLKVFGHRVRRFGAVILEEKPSQGRPDPDAVARILKVEALAAFDSLFPMTGEVRECLDRLAYLRQKKPDLEGFAWLDDPKILLDEWCEGRRSFEELRAINVASNFLNRLTWPQREALKTLAPERMLLPSGSSAKIAYPPGQPPILSARIQQLFGLMETPKIGGKPITVQLLAPNGRPAQITQDLAHFWAHTYADVRKDLRGRYPRHAWPEDPSQAVAEDRPKRRR